MSHTRIRRIAGRGRFARRGRGSKVRLALAAAGTAAAAVVGGCISDAHGVRPEAEPKDGPSALAPLEFLFGGWMTHGRSMQADRSVVETTAVLTIGRYTDGTYRGIREDWYLTAPFLAHDGGSSVRLHVPEAGRWVSKYTLGYPALAWPEVSSFEVVEGAVVFGSTSQSDQTGDHLQRARYFDISSEGWRWDLERSYDGGENWFSIQTLEARRVSDERLSWRSEAPAPTGRVSTLLDGFFGSRALATDPEGNLYIAAPLRRRRGGSDPPDHAGGREADRGRRARSRRSRLRRRSPLRPRP